MTRAAYVHVQEDSHWRVYEALRLNEEYYSGRLQPRCANLLYVDFTHAIRIVQMEKYEDRISAAYYVMAKDFETMAKDVTDGNWWEAISDIKRIRACR